MENYDEYIIDELWEGLITPHTRVTFEIQFMPRSQRFEIIAFHISRVDVAGSAEFVFFSRTLPRLAVLGASDQHRIMKGTGRFRQLWRSVLAACG